MQFRFRTSFCSMERHQAMKNPRPAAMSTGCRRMKTTTSLGVHSSTPPAACRITRAMSKSGAATYALNADTDAPSVAMHTRSNTTANSACSQPRNSTKTTPVLADNGSGISPAPKLKTAAKAVGHKIKQVLVQTTDEVLTLLDSKEKLRLYEPQPNVDHLRPQSTHAEPAAPQGQVESTA